MRSRFLCVLQIKPVFCVDVLRLFQSDVYCRRYIILDWPTSRSLTLFHQSVMALFQTSWETDPTLYLSQMSHIYIVYEAGSEKKPSPALPPPQRIRGKKSAFFTANCWFQSTVFSFKGKMYVIETCQSGKFQATPSISVNCIAIGICVGRSYCIYCVTVTFIPGFYFILVSRYYLDLLTIQIKLSWFKLSSRMGSV